MLNIIASYSRAEYLCNEGFVSLKRFPLGLQLIGLIDHHWLSLDVWSPKEISEQQLMPGAFCSDQLMIAIHYYVLVIEPDGSDFKFFSVHYPTRYGGGHLLKSSKGRGCSVWICYRILFLKDRCSALLVG